MDFQKLNFFYIYKIEIILLISFIFSILFYIFIGYKIKKWEKEINKEGI